MGVASGSRSKRAGAGVGVAVKARRTRVAGVAGDRDVADGVAAKQLSRGRSAEPGRPVSAKLHILGDPPLACELPGLGVAEVRVVVVAGAGVQGQRLHERRVLDQRYAQFTVNRGHVVAAGSGGAAVRRPTRLRKDVRNVRKVLVAPLEPDGGFHRAGRQVEQGPVDVRVAVVFVGEVGVGQGVGEVLDLSRGQAVRFVEEVERRRRRRITEGWVKGASARHVGAGKLAGGFGQVHEIAGIVDPLDGVVALIDEAGLPLDVVEAEVAFEACADAIGMRHLLIVARSEFVRREIGGDATGRIGAGLQIDCVVGVVEARPARRNLEAGIDRKPVQRVGRSDGVAEKRFRAQALFGMPVGEEATRDEVYVVGDVVVAVEAELGAFQAAGQGLGRRDRGAACVELHAVQVRQEGQAGQRAQGRVVVGGLVSVVPNRMGVFVLQDVQLASIG